VEEELLQVLVRISLTVDEAAEEICVSEMLLGTSELEDVIENVEEATSLDVLDGI
jgi:hypothetical protein